MGNRAVIKLESCPKVGIYLHWNGGRNSVEAFLQVAKEMNHRGDESYGVARLTQIISNFFGGTCSIGVNSIDHLDCNNYDNGVYIVKDWEIVGREFFKGEEQTEPATDEILDGVREAQQEPR